MNAEVVARLQSSFDSRPADEGKAVAALAADLARAKRDLAHAAYGRQEKLIQLAMLFDIFQDLTIAADALGLQEIASKADRDLADSIGWEANDELMRQEKELDPYVLFDGIKMSEQEFQVALSKLASVVVDEAPPTDGGVQRLQDMRERIRRRRAQERAEGKHLRDPSNEPTPDEIGFAKKPGTKGKK